MALHFSTAGLALFLCACVSAKDAIDVPRVNTPAPGPWPQSNTTGCGFPGIPVSDILAECTEEIVQEAPDIRGYWMTPEGHIDERIDMCGSRWIDVSASVVHDFPVCTGVVGDGLGCQDYSGPDIINKDSLCSPIVTACKFENDDDGNGCVNLYALTGNPNGEISKVVSRCLQPDGTMIWIHPSAGTVVYTKVPKDEEPNCMMCVGGDHDGVAVTDVSAELPCPYEERQWKKCDDEDDDTTSSSTTHQMDIYIFGLMLPIAFLLLVR